VAVFVKTNLDLFDNMTEINQHNRRDKTKLFIRRVNTTMMHKSIIVMGPIVYNKLPKAIRELNANSFKSRLRKYLLDKCYYNINEYLS
jgi:hypothetical protein